MSRIGTRTKYSYQGPLGIVHASEDIVTGDVTIEDRTTSGAGGGTTVTKESFTITGWRSSGYGETFAHTLGSVPDWISVKLVCTSAADGYVVGDFIEMSSTQHYSSTAPANIGYAVSSTSTEVSYRGSNTNFSIRLPNGSTGANFSADDTDFDIQIDVFKF